MCCESDGHFACPLPARETPLPGESLTSLVRRTSEAMAYEHMRRIRGLIGDSRSLMSTIDYLSPGSPMDRLSVLLDLPVDQLLSLTVHRYARRLAQNDSGECDDNANRINSRKEYFVFQLSPVCPRCFEDDPVPYDRLLWIFRPLPICTAHGCLLISQCPDCGRRIRPNRDVSKECRCGQSFGQIETQNVSSAVVDLARRVEDCLVEGDVPIKHMSSGDFFWWGEKLTTAVLQTHKWLQRTLLDLELPATVPLHATAWMAVADILLHWPDRLCEFLQEYQRVDKYKTTDTGLGRRFGLLLRHAAQLERSVCAAPADALRQYLMDDYVGGLLTGKCSLFHSPEHRRQLNKRTWISLTEAAHQLKISNSTVGKLIRQGQLTRHIYSAGQHGRSVGLVSRQSAERFQEQLNHALDPPQAARALGIGRKIVLRLIPLGVLQNAVHCARGWRIPPASVRLLLESYQQLPVGKPVQSRWLTIRQATRKFGPTGLTLATLLELVHRGQLRARRMAEHNDLRGLLILQGDLSRQMPLIHVQSLETRGYPLNHLAKTLFPGRPTKEAVLKKWIELGLLKATRTGRAWVVAKDEIERFREVYCLVNEASRQLGVARKTLYRWQAEGKIQPVYGRRVTPGAGFTLYRREDVLRLRENGKTTRSRRKGIS